MSRLQPDWSGERDHAFPPQRESAYSRYSQAVMGEAIGGPPESGERVSRYAQPQQSYLAEPHNVYSNQTFGDSTGSLWNEKSAGSTEHLTTYANAPAPARRIAQQVSGKPASTGNKRRALWIIAAIILILAIAGGVIGALIAKKVIKVGNAASPQNAAAIASGGSSAAGATSGAAASPTQSAAAALPSTGGDQSHVVSLDGTQQFIYNNTFGGTWCSIPFDDRAQAQKDTPPLNQKFDYNTNRVRGVNIGGWLNLEPFITPALYDAHNGAATDEWTLALALDAQGAGVKNTTYNQHMSTFITEIDFAQIAGAQLNHVRIPVPFYMIETYPNEPFFTGQWQYLMKGIAWARRYGIRIQLDYHAAPGSQNGWNHSGRGGTINFLQGPMGYANAQRALNHLRVITEFVSQPQYSNVVTEITLLNEPRSTVTGTAPLDAFYTTAFQMMRSITGTNGPLINLGEGFAGLDHWAGFLPGADRLGVDFHVYMAFDSTMYRGTVAGAVTRACGVAPGFRTGFGNPGFLSAGEFSLATNDCGYYLNGVAKFSGSATDSSTGTCAPVIAYQTWSTATKQQYQQLFNAWATAVWHGYFWTWKIAPNAAGVIGTPHWSYKLGLDNGYIPTQWSTDLTICDTTQPEGLAANMNAGAANAATAAAVWPPRSMSSAGRTTYSYYTATGPLIIASRGVNRAAGARKSAMTIDILATHLHSSSTSISASPSVRLWN